MSWSFLKSSVSGEDDSLHRVKVFMEQVSVLLRSEVAHALLDPQLDAAHQLGRLELLVRDLAILDTTVAELLALDKNVFGVIC